MTNASIRLSPTRIRTRFISAACEISSKQAVMSASKTHSYPLFPEVKWWISAIASCARRRGRNPYEHGLKSASEIGSNTSFAAACTILSAVVGNAERASLAAWLGDIHPLDGPGPARARPVLDPVGQFRLARGGQDHPTVDPGRLASCVDLRDPSHADQRVSARAEHQFLQVADPFEVPCLRCREDSLPHRTDSSWACQSTVSQSSGLSSGPFTEAVLIAAGSAAGMTVTVSNLPFGSGSCSTAFFTGSPGPRQHPFGSGHPPVSGQLCGTRRRWCQSLRSVEAPLCGLVS